MAQSKLETRRDNFYMNDDYKYKIAQSISAMTDVFERWLVSV